MGFGTDLQSHSSHQALLQLQDAEIRLLENMRKCMQQRIKSDREYTSMLQLVITQSQKLENSEFNSPVFQVWHTVIRETEQFVKILKQNTDSLMSKTIEKIAKLISEKRAARRAYNEERNRLDTEFNKVQEEVAKHHGEYKRNMEKLTVEKARYEDLLMKGKAGRTFEEAKTKYLKTTVKLHKVHNDYVISLHEASLHQKDYLEKKIPGLLAYHQEVQESMVGQCKEILQEYSNYTNFSRDDFTSSQAELDKAILSISPSLEYKEFIDKNKDDPICAQTFEFDKDLLEEYKGTLKDNQIALDDLTVETLQHNLSGFQDQLALFQNHIEQKTQEMATLEEEIQQLPAANELDEIQKNDCIVKKRAVQILKRDIAELECNERKYTKMIELVSKPVTELGDNAPPSGIDIHDLTTEQIENASSDSNISTITASGSGLKDFKKKFAAGFTTLKTKNPFKKQLGSTPPKPPSRDFLDHHDSGNVSDKNNEKNNSTNQNQEKTSGTTYQQSYQRMSKASHTSIFSNKSDTTSPVHSPTENPLIEEKTSSDRPVDDEEWFHGVLPREEVQRLLSVDGDYLVRESKNKKTEEVQYVLSVMWKGHKHFIIQGENGAWRLEGSCFPTIQELILNQQNSNTPVTNRSQALLKKAILRADWELKNDDIELGPKIGNGNFGDVFKGRFKPTNQEVAVKTCKETLSEEMRKKFLQEGRILKQYDHINIVKFVGIAAHRKPVMIVMEFVGGGALLSYLRKQGNRVPCKDLIKMCEDASAGMAYLESKNCIHRDLAARNCLLDKENNIVKISDFGMSREEEEYTVSDGLKQIPIKWTAPEALNFGRYTSLCDVWSFGILMWEVFSGGSTPYSGMTNQQARDKIDMGYRMPAPEGTPDAAYKLMMKCWEYEPDQRPHFDAIFRELQSCRNNL
ncbi:unnamed protein product [Owenia fusiformis]|uniref:non-specific protein-tyrosine kinase n=1 Tax=Owenia fusiformis TaxID=6347 RepID=A0A8S4P5E8_OWEFU|nr:unnamed protein product [Owenia fusiformis]